MGETVTCGYCRKLVRNKPIIGTMHICLRPEDRQSIDAQRAETTKRFDGQRALLRAGLGPNPYQSLLADRFIYNGQ